jgi:hypothetical protein
MSQELRSKSPFEEELEKKREEFKLAPPKVFEGERRESQRQSALRQLKSRGITGGRRRQRRMTRRKRLARKKQ